MSIKFGTDGWRGIIAEDFTFQNVQFCTQGAVNLWKHHQLDNDEFVVGYDTRFASEQFAETVAEVIAGNKIKAVLCTKPSPTPTVSYNVVSLKAGGGIIITASHNPAQWNGFKYKPNYGGSASPEIVEELELYVSDSESSGIVNKTPLETGKKEGLIRYIDPQPAYLKHLSTLVDLERIKQAGLKIIVDPMFGSGANYLSLLLAGGSTKVIELHNEINPSFPGMVQPEPITQNLGELISKVSEEGADIGLATDGDADRLGVVDEQSHLINSLDTFALLCFHQLGVLKKRGPIVRSITMTSMIDRLGEKYGVPVMHTPVGFKHLGPLMMRENALVAGEESGGYAFRGNIPERDGILSGLMILDLMVKTGKPISKLMQNLIKEVGEHYYDRIDINFKNDQRQSIHKRLQQASPSYMSGKKVEKIDTQDGFRFEMGKSCWSMARFSGTEPLLRIYAEGQSVQEVQSLLSEMRNLAGI